MTHLRTNALKGRHFLRVADWKPDELRALLDLGDELKMLLARGPPHKLLPGRSIALIFNKASTRTRVSFEVGICQLGGTGVSITAARKRGAPPPCSSVRFLNAPTDGAHPCQALADVMTIRERYGHLDGVRLAY